MGSGDRGAASPPPFERAGGGFSGRRSEPPARHQSATYDGNGHATNKEYHSDDHAALRAVVQPLTFNEASFGAGGDDYDDCVFDEPSARVYVEEFVLCARALAREAPADSDAHRVCAPPEVLVSDYTP